MVLAFNGNLTDINRSTVNSMIFQDAQYFEKYVKNTCVWHDAADIARKFTPNVTATTKCTKVHKTIVSASAREISKVLVEDFPNFLRRRTAIVRPFRNVPSIIKIGGA
jgi:hypothetical protein